jgi:hypothetical protein
MRLVRWKHRVRFASWASSESIAANCSRQGESEIVLASIQTALHYRAASVSREGILLSMTETAPKVQSRLSLGAKANLIQVKLGFQSR